jgi:hypothetical protein
VGRSRRSPLPPSIPKCGRIIWSLPNRSSLQPARCCQHGQARWQRPAADAMQLLRDLSWSACNKREPGSGCAALGGVMRFRAGARGTRCSRRDRRPRRPEGHPFRGTARSAERHAAYRNCAEPPGELITGSLLPVAPWTHRSLYLKIRDRQSYEFALAAAAVALDLADGLVREARIALAGRVEAMVGPPGRSSAAGWAIDEFLMTRDHGVFWLQAPRAYRQNNLWARARRAGTRRQADRGTLRAGARRQGGHLLLLFVKNSEIEARVQVQAPPAQIPRHSDPYNSIGRDLRPVSRLRRLNRTEWQPPAAA